MITTCQKKTRRLDEIIQPIRCEEHEDIYRKRTKSVVLYEKNEDQLKKKSCCDNFKCSKRWYDAPIGRKINPDRSSVSM